MGKCKKVILISKIIFSNDGAKSKKNMNRMLTRKVNSSNGPTLHTALLLFGILKVQIKTMGLINFGRSARSINF